VGDGRPGAAIVMLAFSVVNRTALLLAIDAEEMSAIQSVIGSKPGDRTACSTDDRVIDKCLVRAGVPLVPWRTDQSRNPGGKCLLPQPL
jgi:hypothetical protein